VASGLVCLAVTLTRSAECNSSAPAHKMVEQKPYHEVVKERFAPSVVVVSDAGVQAACAASGLSLVDILRACSVDASVGPQGMLDLLLENKQLHDAPLRACDVPHGTALADCCH
jgi:hypothetical protein